jgi:threonine synthase
MSGSSSSTNEQDPHDRSYNVTVSLVLRCHGCAAIVDVGDPAVRNPFRCPNADRAPNVDHVLSWDPVSAGVTEWPGDTSRNPYIRYRTLQHAYWLNRSLGATDADHVALVNRLDASIEAIAGTGFAVTPLIEFEHAAQALGVSEVWGKVETGNVGGSHKARHLMGILLHLEARRISARIPLAIASCGNAAIAAATLGKASKRSVHVFIPTWTKQPVRDRLTALGATLTESPRLATDPPGDPCLHRFHDALKKGALPFCVQGTENGLTIDGGASLGHELADQYAMLGFVPDRLFVQTGGGALGSSVARGLLDAHALGVVESLPRMHFVQAEGCAPLERAWRKVAGRAIRSLGLEGVVNDFEIAEALRADSSREAVAEALSYAVTHRSQFMTVWEDEPTSIATGILDDETYDWFALVRVMIATGGWPVVATERQIEKALVIACPDDRSDSCCNTDHTGASSLAGAIALAELGLLDHSERISTLITGVRR